jgi:hypothetical protein
VVVSVAARAAAAGTTPARAERLRHRDRGAVADVVAAAADVVAAAADVVAAAADVAPVADGSAAADRPASADCAAPAVQAPVAGPGGTCVTRPSTSRSFSLARMLQSGFLVGMLPPPVRLADVVWHCLCTHDLPLRQSGCLIRHKQKVAKR